MISFVATTTPVSVNAKSKPRYKEALVSALKATHGDVAPLTGELYGFAYYFHKTRTQLDADNLSKPIWDALNGYLYSDDKSIRIRYSGIIAVTTGFTVLDITRVPHDTLGSLLTALAHNDHVLYVEVGQFRPNLFTFNGESL